jgi:L-aminopeptidase/D-esterase-like protein
MFQLPGLSSRRQLCAMKDRLLKNNCAITDIPGIQVGHATDLDAITGCTVILCPAGAVGGVDQRGGAPGTRETDALHPYHLVQRIHAVVLSGGSAFGLDSASGAVRCLEERGVGFETPAAKVPIVAAAILYDLGIGRADVRPDASMGYRACLNAQEGPIEEGNVGAGTGASIGKIFGMENAVKGGLGTSSLHLDTGLIIGALAAVNPFGDVVDPSTGEIVAGARRPESGGSAPHSQNLFADTLQVMRGMPGDWRLGFQPEAGNTVIGVVATNACLNKEQVNKVAQMAQDGVARTIRPAHTLVDGDTIFALSLGDILADVSLVGAFAAEVLSQAILRAVWAAPPLAGLPSASSLREGLKKDVLNER